MGKQEREAPLCANRPKESRGECLLLHVRPPCRCDGKNKETRADEEEEEENSHQDHKRTTAQTDNRGEAGVWGAHTQEPVWGFAICSNPLVIAFLQASLGCNGECCPSTRKRSGTLYGGPDWRGGQLHVSVSSGDENDRMCLCVRSSMGKKATGERCPRE